MPSTLLAIVNAVAAYLLVVFVCTVEIARLECGASACDLQTAPDPTRFPHVHISFMITYLYPNYEWGHHDLSVLGSNPFCTLAFDRCFMRKHTLFSLSLCRVPLLPRMTQGIMGVVVFIPNVRPSLHRAVCYSSCTNCTITGNVSINVNNYSHSE